MYCAARSGVVASAKLYSFNKSVFIGPGHIVKQSILSLCSSVRHNPKNLLNALVEAYKGRLENEVTPEALETVNKALLFPLVNCFLMISELKVAGKVELSFIVSHTVF